MPAPYQERAVALGARGTTWVREAAGPDGAPTLLLLHGLGATGGLNWYASMRALGSHYRVVALDHRGHGRGVRARGRFRLADCADDAAALLEALAIPRAIAVGYSMGGPIAQLLWHRHPARVAGLVLCATAASFARPERRRTARQLSPWLHAVSRALPRGAVRRLTRGALDDVEDPRARAWLERELGDSDPVAMAEAGAALARFSSEAWIGEVDVPAAVVVTQRDSLVSPQRQLALAAALPGATLHGVDADHRACVERPDLFVPALLDACASVARRKRPARV